jgi:sugar O-acyltransferase (sialic acid O-acetyltransferase NeuD family)
VARDIVQSGTSYVLIGAGGHAASVADVIGRLGSRVEVFVDDAVGDDSDVVIRAGVYAADERLQLLPSIVAIGSNSARARLQPELLSPAAAVLASTATGEVSRISAGTIVFEHAHVGPNSTVGQGCIVNTGAIIEHDCSVGDYVHVAPRAVLLGGVTVMREAFVGAGATVLPGVTVGAGAVIGSGAVVTRNVENGATVAGVPARRLR